MLIDTHAHLNFAAFNNDREEMIKKCLDNNVWIINAGTKYETSKKAVEIANKWKEGVYAAIGLHPIHLATGIIKVKTDPAEGGFTAKGECFCILKYKKLAQSSKVVAIGEIGLDYYYAPQILKDSFSNTEQAQKRFDLFCRKQKELLLEQIKLAKELNLPIIFHCRKAHQDLIKILKAEFSDLSSKGVVHCFTGRWKEAEEYLKMGFYLGFNGIIFKLDLKEVIKKTPLERILVETDCPYLKPPEFPEERNNPLAVKLIIQRVAEIKNLNFQTVAEATFKNAKELFGI